MSRLPRILDLFTKKRRRIIGLMSGMSLDGVDLVCADIAGKIPGLEVNWVGSHFRPFASEIRERLARGREADAAEVSRLNVLVAQEFAACVREFLHGQDLTPESIDAIGSHGQTLYHATGVGEVIPSTLQVGSPSILAELTGIVTVGNFRVRDIAAGGTGAPLVSFAEFAMSRGGEDVIAFNNLGSISNVTVVTPSREKILAFDTGPANMAIDYFARKIEANESGFDDKGRFSAQGKVIDNLLAIFLQNPFFALPPPKAAGYEEFGPEYLNRVAAPFAGAPLVDLVRTAVEFSAQTIASAYRNVVLPDFPTLKKVKFSGGGIYNQTLMSRIRALLPELEITTLASEFSDGREALAFAILANETLSARTGSLSSVTGARHDCILGEIAF